MVRYPDSEVPDDSRRGDRELALGYLRAGRFNEAIETFRRLCSDESPDVEDYSGLGVAFAAIGRDQEAIDTFRKGLGIDPRNANVISNLGMLLTRIQQYGEAEELLNRGRQLHPLSSAILNNLGHLFQRTSRPQRARESFSAAIQSLLAASPLMQMFSSNSIESYEALEWKTILGALPAARSLIINFAVSLQACSEHELALRCLDGLIAHSSRDSYAYFLRALSLDDLGEQRLAIEACRRSLEIDPTDAQVWNSYGKLFLQSNQLVNADAAFRQALQVQPDLLNAWLNLGMLQQTLNNHEQAVACYEEAYRRAPNSINAAVALANQYQWACDWRNIDALTKTIISKIQGQNLEPASSFIPPFWFICLTQPTSPADQRKVAECWSNKVALRNPLVLTCFRNDKASKEKLRIGYLSSDFGEHATTFLIAELFAEHDRRQFEIFGYSYGCPASYWKSQVAAGFDCFRDISEQSHRKAAEQIASDKIDILVDLKGYTQYARPEILSLRPAPIQATYLGYPGTLGSSFVDYALVDEFVVPKDQAGHYAERLIALPGCYQVNRRLDRRSAELSKRGDHNLQEGTFVYCAFNNPFKISPQIFQLWMQILSRVPNAVLWLLGDNAVMQRNLSREAEKHHVASERIVFAPRVRYEQHLHRHTCADLFLDTFPYNAHTTASDAIRMGIPIVTRIGQAFSSRVAGSLLRTVGLGDFVTESESQYVELAVELACNRERLDEVKSRLRSGLEESDLFDPVSFARKLESAYRQMWREWIEGATTSYDTNR